MDDTGRRRVEARVGTAAFALLAAVAASRHEMWRDELEIWLIARDSATPFELLANMATEGHPALWYAIVWLVTRLTSAPVAMQATSVAIGTAGVWLLLRHAPFRLPERLLLAFGYFQLYEFTVISRAYGLQLLLVFLFCALRGRRVGPVWQAVCLAALAHTTLYGTMIAGLGALLMLTDRRADRTGGPAFAAPVAVVGAAALAFFHVLDQSRRIGPDHAGAHRPGWDVAWIVDGFATIGRAFVPIAEPGSPHPWNSHVLDALPGSVGAALGLALSLALGWIAVVLLSADRRLLALFLLGATVMLGLTLFVWHGSMRHHGQVFLLFVALWWLSLDDGGPGRSDPPREARVARAVLVAALAAQLVASGQLVASDLQRPFSHARSVAGFLSTLEDDPIVVGSFDYAAQPIAAWLDGPIYYPESRRFGTFMRWGPERSMVPPAVVIETAVRLARENGRPVVLVLCYRLGDHDDGVVLRWDDEELVHLAGFEGALVEDENYHVYRLRPSEPRRE